MLARQIGLCAAGEEPSPETLVERFRERVLSGGVPGMSDGRRSGHAMGFVRLWLPLLIILAGLTLGIAIGTDSAWEGGALLISAGLSVWLLNVLFRLGVRGDRERAHEEQARDEFERTGRWPGDDEPPAAPPGGGTS